MIRETLDEHDLLTTQPNAQMIEAGAARIQAEREIFRKERWGEPSDEHLAANVYEEADDFEEAVDEFLAELLRVHGPRE